MDLLGFGHVGLPFPKSPARLELSRRARSGESRRGNTSQSRLSVHQIVDVKDEVGRHSRDSFTLRHGIEKMPQFGMVCYIRFDVLEFFACRFEGFLEFRPRFD